MVTMVGVVYGHYGGGYPDDGSLRRSQFCNEGQPGLFVMIWSLGLKTDVINYCLAPKCVKVTPQYMSDDLSW